VIVCIRMEGGREVRGIDTYGMLIGKGYIARTPWYNSGGTESVCGKGNGEIWVGAWAYAFGAHLALGYALIRPLSYTLAIPRPSLSYAA